MKLHIALNKFRYLASFCCVLLLLNSTASAADELKQHQINISGGGVLTLEAPEWWGKKLDIKRSNDGQTDIQFAGLGTKRNPVFAVSLFVRIATDELTQDVLKEMAKVATERFANVAIESEVLINEFDHPNGTGYYFAITDRERKPREYQYLTMALMITGGIVIQFQFLSNDSAPDFGADAMHMMRNATHTIVQE